MSSAQLLSWPLLRCRWTFLRVEMRTPPSMELGVVAAISFFL